MTARNCSARNAAGANWRTASMVSGSVPSWPPADCERSGSPARWRHRGLHGCASASAPTFPARPLPSGNGGEGVAPTGRLPYSSSPKRTVARPSLSTSTAKCGATRGCQEDGELAPTIVGDRREIDQQRDSGFCLADVTVKSVRGVTIWRKSG